MAVIAAPELIAQPVVDDRAKALQGVQDLSGCVAALAAQCDASAVPRPRGLRWGRVRMVRQTGRTTMLLASLPPPCDPRAYTDLDRVGSLVRCLLASRGSHTESGGNARFHNAMAIQDTQPREDERAAQEHERSADVYERHAVLMDRFGALRTPGRAPPRRRRARRRPGRSRPG